MYEVTERDRKLKPGWKVLVKHPYKMVRMSRKLNKVKIGFEINLYF